MPSSARSARSASLKPYGHIPFELFDIEITGTQNPAVIELIDVMKVQSSARDSYSENNTINGWHITRLHVYFVDTQKLFGEQERLTDQAGNR